MQPTMAWRFDGRITVIVHSERSPTNLEWRRFLTDATEVGFTAQRRILVISHGGGPDGDQRRELMEAARNTPAPVVMMTKSALVRGIMTALTFFNPVTKVVNLDDDEQAYDFLGLSSGERESARRLRADLERELGLRSLASSSART
jgi:hypothetical protein